MLEHEESMAETYNLYGADGGEQERREYYERSERIAAADRAIKAAADRIATAITPAALRTSYK